MTLDFKASGNISFPFCSYSLRFTNLRSLLLFEIMLSCLSAHIKLSGTAFLISIHSEIQLDFTFNFDHSWMLVIKSWRSLSHMSRRSKSLLRIKDFTIRDDIRKWVLWNMFRIVIRIVRFCQKSNYPYTGSTWYCVKSDSSCKWCILFSETTMCMPVCSVHIEELVLL